MNATPIQLLSKVAVTERLGISERTLEKLVRAHRFPPPLRLGKEARWDGVVVETWLEQALMPQRNWRPRRRPAGGDARASE